MGLDVIGWRDCSLQKDLGRDDFLGRLKLRSYKAAIEQQLPEEQWETAKLNIRINGEVRQSSYREVCDQLAEFTKGCPECASCALGGASGLDCYRYVSYPVDNSAESLLFTFFGENFKVTGSPSQQLYVQAMCRTSAYENGYHARGEGSIADLAELMSTSFQVGEDSITVDSADLLGVLFGIASEPAPRETLSQFFAEFFRWLDALEDKGLPEFAMSEDGALELNLSVGAEDLAENMATQLLAMGHKDSRTLAECRALLDMLQRQDQAADDWSLVFDG